MPQCIFILEIMRAGIAGIYLRACGAIFCKGLANKGVPAIGLSFTGAVAQLVAMNMYMQ